MKITVELQQKGIQVSDITFEELLKDRDNPQLQLQVLDSTFEVVLNLPWVLSIGLPSTILAGFLIYPTKLELQFADRKYSKAKWYRTVKV